MKRFVIFLLVLIIKASSFVYAQRVVVLGNSITIHPISDYWWGEWGMAASERTCDFVHKLEKKINQVGLNAKVIGYNIADWERNFFIDKDSLLLNRILGSEYIIVRLGENVPKDNLELFPDAIDDLLDYLKSKTTASLFVTSTFWKDSLRSDILKRATLRNNIMYIEISDLDKPENESCVGASVYGDDNQWHIINHSGVAHHPNDLGMQLIADRLYENIFLSTSIANSKENQINQKYEYGLNGILFLGMVRIYNGHKYIMK